MHNSYSPFASSSQPSRSAHVLWRTRRLAARAVLFTLMHSPLVPREWRSCSGRDDGDMRRWLSEFASIVRDAASGIGRRRRYLRPLDVETRDGNGYPLGLDASTFDGSNSPLCAPYPLEWLNRTDRFQPPPGGPSLGTSDGLRVNIPFGCRLSAAKVADALVPSIDQAERRDSCKYTLEVTASSTRPPIFGPDSPSGVRQDGRRGPQPPGDE